MRVLCIDKSKFKNLQIEQRLIDIIDCAIKYIEEGVTYTVTGIVHPPDDEDHYILEEFPGICWESSGFAPVSDQENLQLTEMEAEEIRRRHFVQVKYNL